LDYLNFNFMDGQAGKGDKWRKGTNFSKFQEGMDNIKWSPKTPKQELVRPPDEPESLTKAKEIRARLTKDFGQPKNPTEPVADANQELAKDEQYLKSMLTET
jgi:hypothetical protein